MRLKTLTVKAKVLLLSGAVTLGTREAVNWMYSKGDTLLVGMLAEIQVSEVRFERRDTVKLVTLWPSGKLFAMA